MIGFKFTLLLLVVCAISYFSVFLVFLGFFCFLFLYLRTVLVCLHCSLTCHNALPVVLQCPGLMWEPTQVFFPPVLCAVVKSFTSLHDISLTTYCCYYFRSKPLIILNRFSDMRRRFIVTPCTHHFHCFYFFM